ncbi:hypothetical protein GCM10025771_42600 [Niveibacterium umoris]|uniref:Immunity protein 72 domain-containing protein n=1 Tax=Niveibacterium umoris TaxID=1193620 RepID=A0A840BMH9_9RHOO|nr:hypothetical protein [Niveibacterium umoris]MBB4014741.1 hypothetical protein [Niveibacterium umoris]
MLDSDGFELLPLPAHVQTMSREERDRRKTWLKQHFASFEYHEHLLELHDAWLTLIKREYARVTADPSLPQPQRWFGDSAIPNFEKLAKPGTIARDQFRPGYTFGAAIYILDYSRDTGLDVEQTWEWMPEPALTQMHMLWGRMNRIAQNIQYTVDETWDSDPNDCDWILDEQYTGPIFWPSEFDPVPAANPVLRCPGGEPCPQAGWWSTPAKADSRRHFVLGEVMPSLKSDYGYTIWQFEGA